MSTWQQSTKVLGGVLAICAVIGLGASFTLLGDTFAVARDPSFNPSCNINPLLSCASVMESDQAEFLGIPNPAFGIAAFTALLVFAVLVWVDTKFKPWVWKAGLGAATAGLAYVVYLYLTSLLVLGTICPWCFVTWLVTIATFWALWTHALAEGYVGSTKIRAALVRNAPLILASLYAVLLFGILIRFHEALLG